MYMYIYIYIYWDIIDWLVIMRITPKPNRRKTPTGGRSIANMTSRNVSDPILASNYQIINLSL